jgi:hypothetical protein
MSRPVFCASQCCQFGCCRSSYPSRQHRDAGCSSRPPKFGIGCCQRQTESHCQCEVRRSSSDCVFERWLAILEFPLALAGSVNGAPLVASENLQFDQM